jgi:polysaccharide biosynthesis protein PslH
MKIVSIVWFKVFPATFGGQKGIVFFLRHLSAYLDITCICSRDNIVKGKLPFKIIPLLSKGKFQFINPIVWFNILREIRREKAKVLIIEHPYHAVTGILAKKLLKIKLVLHQHNIEYIRFKEFRNIWWPILKVFENWISKEADLIFFKTLADQENAIRLFQLMPQKTLIVPYGIEIKMGNKNARCKIRETYNLPQDSKIFLFAATLDYKPNADAVEHIFSILVPILDSSFANYKIIICGRNKIKNFDYLNKLHSKNVIMAGEVNNIDDFYNGADLFINPVITGGGIQTKTMDALSYQLPVVCFENMLAGIPLEFVNSLIFPVNKEDWQKFADNMALIKKESSDSKLSEYIMANSWDAIAQQAAHNIKMLE